MANKHKIGDFLKRFKRPITLIADKEYKLVTISSKHRGIKLRELKKGALIKSKMYEVKSGDFIVSGIDARNGAFGIIPDELDGAIVTNDFWYFEIDESIIIKKLFLELTATTWFDEICTRGSDGTTNRVRLQKDRFFNQKVILPDYKEQKVLLKHLLTFKTAKTHLSNEISSQKRLLKSLKQSILQEAIQGKLTVDWRKENKNIEPASELLKQIKAEKNKLVKEKKIKKEKSLPAILENEIPFELPDSWSWARLGDLCSKTGSGKTPKGGKSVYSEEGVKFIRSQNVYDDGLILDGIAHISNSIHSKMKSTEVKPEDLLLNITGGSIGRCCIVPSKFNTANINQHVAIIRPIISSICYFIHNVICSPYFQAEIIRCQTGAGREGLPKGKMDNILIPIPSLEEQKVIVEKVDSLIKQCVTLQQEIIRSETNAQMLSQSVLKEAFESKEIKETKVIELPTKPTNIDYYKRTLLATEIVWQLQKEPTLGHLKLQKLIYLAQESSTMLLPTNFLQQVAGPYDPKMARSLDKQMKTKKWFEYKKSELLKFKPLEKAGKHKADFEKFFANEKDSIQYIIDTFKTAKSDSLELVGTLYACWKKLIEEKQIATDELISKRFYEWSEQKAKFEPNRILKALRWMETRGIIPEKADA